MKRATIAIAVLAAAGVADAAYGIVQHYGPVGTGVCNWGGRISCDIVNKSVFSEIAGVPVAAIGVLGYLLILGVALAHLKRADARGGAALLALAVGGFLFSAYLTWVEFYLLGAYCPICVVSQSLITAILVLSLVVFRGSRLPRQSA